LLLAAYKFRVKNDGGDKQLQIVHKVSEMVTLLSDRSVYTNLISCTKSLKIFCKVTFRLYA
jgi:hypothetical protein